MSESAPNPKDPKDSSPSEDQDIYELDLPEDEPAAPQAPASKPKPRSPQQDASKQAPPRQAPEAGDDEAYELSEEPDEAGKGGGGSSPKIDPRFETQSPPAPSSGEGGASGAGQASGGSSDRPKTSVYTPAEDEPAFVDPEVAAMRREDARVRAAQEEHEAETRRRQIKLIAAAACLGAAIVIFVLFYLF